VSKFWEHHKAVTGDNINKQHRVSMEQSASWKVNGCSNTQENPRFLKKPEIHYRAHKEPKKLQLRG
jgi:hypothetical protein